MVSPPCSEVPAMIFSCVLSFFHFVAGSRQAGAGGASVSHEISEGWHLFQLRDPGKLQAVHIKQSNLLEGMEC